MGPEPTHRHGSAWPADRNSVRSEANPFQEARAGPLGLWGTAPTQALVWSSIPNRMRAGVIGFGAAGFE
jgi:hypothetical protein